MEKAASFRRKKFDPLYHFLLIPLVLFVSVIAATLMVDKLAEEAYLEAAFMILVALTCMGLLALVRLYPLATQKRVIRLEVSLRYLALTGEHFHDKARHLDDQQVAALSYAGDEEFLVLLDKAIDEKLRPDEILRRIENWKPDFERIR